MTSTPQTKRFKTNNDVSPNPSVHFLKQKAARILNKIDPSQKIHQRESESEAMPHSIDNPIIISDNDDDDDDGDDDTSTSFLSETNSIIVISDNEDDIPSPPRSTNVKQHHTIGDSDVEMGDQLVDSDGDYGKFIPAGDFAEDSKTTYLDDKNNINPRQQNQQTHTLKRSRERSISEEDSDDVTTRDDNYDKNYMMQKYPWWRLHKGKLSSLQEQVMDFVQYLRPRKHEILLRHYLVHKIRYALQAKWEGAQVNVFGSFGSNTFLPDSDIDMVVSSLPNRYSLYTVSEALKEAGVFRSSSIIGSATVPVLKFADALTRIKIDIVLVSSNGVECTEHMSDILDQYPCSRELTLMVKHRVALGYLHNVYTGGIGGLSVTCLVIRFLQEHTKLASGTTNLDQELGGLLLEFFHRYGFKFQLGKERISIAGNGYSKTTGYYRARQGQPVFSIMHPLDPSNDIGAKSFNAAAIVQLFRATYTSMVSASSLNNGVGNANPQPARGASVAPSCLLSGIGVIPPTMVQQRALMEEVYVGQKWCNELAAATFDWNMQV